jgi:hypothetical protein
VIAKPHKDLPAPDHGDAGGRIVADQIVIVVADRHQVTNTGARPDRHVRAGRDAELAGDRRGRARAAHNRLVRQRDVVADAYVREISSAEPAPLTVAALLLRAEAFVTRSVPPPEMVVVPEKTLFPPTFTTPGPTIERPLVPATEESIVAKMLGVVFTLALP